MAVTTTDIHFFKASEGDSEGGAMGPTEITGSAKNNFWINVSDAERTAGGTRIRKWFVENQHATDSLLVPSTYAFQTPTNTTEQLGVGFDDADDDDATQGNMTAFGATAVLSATSDGADTRSLTVVGLNGSGTPTEETIVLTGATEKLTTGTFSVVYACKMSAISASRTVTIKQGAGGTTRGTIAANMVSCWLWVTATSKATGIKRVNLTAGSQYGFWDKLAWSAGAGSIRPTQSVIGVEEAT